MPREGTKTRTRAPLLIALARLRLDMPREGTKTNVIAYIVTSVLLRLDMPREGTKTYSNRFQKVKKEY